MTIFRRTKIITTLGPATDDPQALAQLLDEGVDLVRLNFSHGDASDHQKRARMVRDYSKTHQREIGILADLQGPKIRIARFKNGFVELHEDEPFILDAKLDENEGNEQRVGIDYRELTKDVHPGDLLMLDDGRIQLQVSKVKRHEIFTTVMVGGTLSNNKGINRFGGGLSATTLTKKDKEDLKTAIALGADYIALSFVRNADEVNEARKLIKKAKGNAGIIAKIERKEALENIEAITVAADGVMVARGDLGVELGDAGLPSIQKHIIDRARALDRAVITATQMMESMIDSTIPTRAEVSDVANAVLDGTDAVMLSAETAAGKHPHRVVQAMSRICLGAEKNPATQISKHRVECTFARVDEAIAMAAMYTANHLEIKAIAALTESGSTPIWMSRIRSGIPIFALTRHVETQRKMTLYRGVYPIGFDATELERQHINKEVLNHLQNLSLIEKGDHMIITKGDFIGVHGQANAMKVVTVGELK